MSMQGDNLLDHPRRDGKEMAFKLVASVESNGAGSNGG